MIRERAAGDPPADEALARADDGAGEVGAFRVTDGGGGEAGLEFGGQLLDATERGGDCRARAVNRAVGISNSEAKRLASISIGLPR